VWKAERGGNLRLTSAAWEDARVALHGQVVEFRWEYGQVVVTRKGVPVAVASAGPEGGASV
jgi:hypothetical protein